MATLALCASSCKMKSQIATNERVIRVTERDTHIITEPDSCSIQALLSCDSLGNVLINENSNLRDSLNKMGKTNAKGMSAKGKKNSKINVKINNNVLEADCECDTMAILATVRDSTITDKEVKTDIKEREFKWYETALMWSGILAWILLLIFICKKMS